MFKLLTICPTKGRPELFFDMYSSWKATRSEGTELVVSLDEDDWQLPEYKNILTLECIPFFVSMDQTLTEHFNNCWGGLPGYDFYHMTNDDVVYQTEGWDKLLIDPIKNRAGISYGNDLLQGSNLPTFPVISSEILETLGWLQQPRIDKLWGDSVWKEIGHRCDCLFYVPKAILEHRHWINGKRSQDDENYKKVFERDHMNYMNWYANDAILDIRKVRKVCNGTASV